MAGLGRMLYNMSFWVRETGQAMDRLGSRLQGLYPFQEQLSRHRTIMHIHDQVPMIAEDVFVAPNAAVVGDVSVGLGSSIWYGCVLRGYGQSIRIGSGTNIQDHSLVHVMKANVTENTVPTIIGDRVTIGHSAVLHGCTIEDEALVGMGATLLDGVYVEKHAMIAAGALVKQNTRIPSGQLWGGNPAKFLRNLTDEEIAFFAKSAESYGQLAGLHLKENTKTLQELHANRALTKRWYIPKQYDDLRLGIVYEKPPVQVDVMGSASS